MEVFISYIYLFSWKQYLKKLGERKAVFVALKLFPLDVFHSFSEIQKVFYSAKMPKLVLFGSYLKIFCNVMDSKFIVKNIDV